MIEKGELLNCTYWLNHFFLRLAILPKIYFLKFRVKIMKAWAVLFFLITHQVVIAGHETNMKGYYRMNWKSFYSLPEVNKVINVHKPDYELLDAAIFHATNEIRENHFLPLFIYSPILHQSSELHSTNMINLDFYDHNNEKNLKFYKLENRIKTFGGNFSMSAENIAQFQIVNTKYYYCPTPQNNGSYKYLNCETNKPFPVYTYLEYAKMVVKSWYESPGHRPNLLNSNLTLLGCAARISKDPYLSKNAPFARLTQNFAGGEFPLLLKVKFEEK
ncbi:hypothetical protein BH23BAC1_BH23BAC1_39220 [soil metagenome]